MVKDSDTLVPCKNDFFFGYATVSGYKSFRHEIDGTYFVTELCRSLASYGRYMSLERMMKETNKRVNTDYKGLEQPTETTHGLNKDVFFF